MQTLIASDQMKELVKLVYAEICIFPASSAVIKFSDRNVDNTAIPVKTQCHVLL